MDAQGMTIVNNILSLLNELKTMEGNNEGEDQMKNDGTDNPYNQDGTNLDADEDIQMANNKPDDESFVAKIKTLVKEFEGTGKEDDRNKEGDEEMQEKEVMKEKSVKKTYVSTDGDVFEEKGKKGGNTVNANDKAEEEVEDVNPDTTDDALDVLTKAIMTAISPKKVEKSRATSDKSNEKMLEVLKAMADRIEQQDKVLKDIITGLGVSEVVMKKYNPDNQVGKPLGNVSDVNKSLEYIAGLIQKNNGQQTVDTHEQPIDSVRKSLRDPSLLRALVGGNK